MSFLERGSRVHPRLAFFLTLAFVSLQIPASSSQCQLYIPPSVLSNSVVPTNPSHREYDPGKFTLLDLSYLCYSKQLPEDQGYKDARISIFYTYDNSNFSLLASLYCRGSRWSFREHNNRPVFIADPEAYKPVNLTKDGCLDCFYDKPFSQPTRCREVDVCGAYQPCQDTGTCLSQDDGQFSCDCHNGWGGELCTDCPLSCLHGGQLQPETCSCSCVGHYTGENCEVCGLACENGGVLNDTTCSCSCTNSFKGERCEVCDLSCVNGVLNGSQCSCVCPPQYSGLQCGVCDLSCVNGVLNGSQCSCVCPPQYSGLQCGACDLTCQNGGALNSSSCSCSCDGGFTGLQCQTCGLSCQNGGTLDGASCSCTCDGGYSGPQCQSCDLTCQNGGALNSSSCSCSCDGGFTGLQCQICGLSSCRNGGIRNASSCTCQCVQPHYSGLRCQVCDLTCAGGATLDGAACVCACPAYSTGIRCEANISDDGNDPNREGGGIVVTNDENGDGNLQEFPIAIVVGIFLAVVAVLAVLTLSIVFFTIALLYNGSSSSSSSGHKRHRRQ